MPCSAYSPSCPANEKYWCFRDWPALSSLVGSPLRGCESFLGDIRTNFYEDLRWMRIF